MTLENSNIDFFWKTIEIENYSNIIEQMQSTMLPSLLRTTQHGLFHYDLEKFKHICPLFIDWVEKKSLQIRTIAIIKTLPTIPQDIHCDFIPVFQRNTYAINLNLYNCIDTYTRMFKLKNKMALPPISYGSEKKPFFSYTEDMCTEVTRYNLEKPILLNVGQIHQVINDTGSPRISVSFRCYGLEDLD